MNLFRVEMWGQNKTFHVRGNGAPGVSKTFFVSQGPYLQVIDMVKEMGGGLLKSSNGPATIRGRSPEIEAILKAND